MYFIRDHIPEINISGIIVTYIEGINLFYFIIFFILYLFLLHYAVLGVVGVFTRKTFPHAKHKNKFGLIIPARNEESVIATIIKSIRKTDYPQELLDIFVIAHNCTDNTAAIARSAGAHVYEYNNPAENTVGYALRQIFKFIEADYGNNSFDGFFIFDADNTFDEKYFDRMNDAFEYYDRKYVISSFRQASNFNENIMTVLYGAYFATTCYLGSRGRTVLNTSNRIYGCGYVFNSELVKDGWNYVSLTEDLEFSAKEVLKGTQIRYCDDAVFYDEQPTSFRIMWKQRLRWAKGHLSVSGENFARLAKAVFEPGRKNRYAAYDMAAFNSRPILVVEMIKLIKYFCMLLSPLFGGYIEQTLQIILYDFVNGILSFSAISAVLYLLTMFCGRERFRSVSPAKKLAGVFLFPIFLLFQFIMDVQALFSKDLTWEAIPHIGKKDT